MLIYIVISTLLGLVMGSFAGATVWRLRARQLKEDKAAGESVDNAEYHRLLPLTKRSHKADRSQCLGCGHVLRWIDLIPLVSWVSTKGRCRYCQKKIGSFEPIIEAGSALLFGLFAVYWFAQQSYGLTALLAVWLVVLVLMIIAIAYDAKWFLLPDVVMFPLIILSGIIAVVHVVQAPDAVAAGLSTLGAVGLLSGLYLALWLISRGGWIGFGDVKLGLALGLLLGTWQEGLLALFLANFIGLLFVLPGLVSGKLSRKTHVPFGPFMILGFFITLFYGDHLFSLYNSAAVVLADWLITLML